MHRIIAFICTAGALLFLLGGCAGREELLSYVPRFLSAEVEEGGRLWRITSGEGVFTAVLLAPDSAAGITLRLTDAEASASAAQMRIPLGGRMYESASRMFSCFARRAEDVTDVRADPQTGGVHITFSDGMRISLDKEGNPLFFERDGTRYTVTALQLRQNR